MDNRKKLLVLAEKIATAGRVISQDNISKDYFIGNGYAHSIIVRSDSGYEAIYIGNLEGRNTDGYMCLYTNNTSQRNSFPDVNVIAELLGKVLEKEKLEVGEGKAYYYDWDEFGGIDKQLNYFSQIVSELAGISIKVLESEYPKNELSNKNIDINNKVTKEEVESDVRRHFATFFTEYRVPDKVVINAVDDVLLASGIVSEGCYNDSDISLACQRAIMQEVGEAV